ncbi:MAG: hypothetical protein EZS28_006904 [Streblomastix strix]|uniref:Uncharacterized protein n=1 Tax=Streblomastix strix TaxID=222440 RepID=A0A5J4WSS3_9EUKA|nr:MAG: hypothetical protein EZS28_006904 [Streblomastix strix]
MTSIPAQNIEPQQENTDPTRRLSIHIGGTIIVWVIALIACAVLVVVGIILLAALPGATKVTGAFLFLLAIVIIISVFALGRYILYNKDLLFDANEGIGSFDQTPHPWAIFCCLSTVHRQFQLTDVSSIQQLKFRYGRRGEFTAFKVTFVLPNNEMYQPKIDMCENNVIQIVQFFRIYNSQRQNQAPVQGQISTGQYGITETVYSLDAPFAYAAYPPYNPDLQQLGIYPRQQRGFFQQQQRFAPPNQQQGFAPPNQQQGFAPPNQQQGFAPPNQQQGFAPPNQQQGFAPPNQQQAQYAPPNQQQGFDPQTQQQTLYAPPNQQQGFAPLSQQQAQYAPPSQQQRQQTPPIQLQQGQQAPINQQQSRSYSPQGKQPQRQYQRPKQQQGQQAPNQQQSPSAFPTQQLTYPSNTQQYQKPPNQ